MRVLITLALIVGLLFIAVLSLLNIGRELLRPTSLLSVQSARKSMVDGNSPEADANAAPHCPVDTGYREKSLANVSAGSLPAMSVTIGLSLRRRRR